MQCRYKGPAAAILLLLAYEALLLQLQLPQAGAAAPPLELSKWNRAYKLTVSNIDSKLKEQYNLVEQACVKDVGFDRDATSATLDSCYYHQEKNGTFTKWAKKAGEWRMNTNCYCYALNVYRDGFCIPGRSSEAVTDALMSGQERSCKLMTAAVLADGAVPATKAQAMAAAPPPAGSHYIGLLVRKRSCIPTHCWQNDFHLVRRDANGNWSWKEPGGPASALDINNQPVSDPEAAATAGLLPGRYNIWCGFFLVNPSTMKIGGNFEQPYSLQSQAAFLQRLPGIAVSLHELPYNHSVDGAPDRFTQELIDQDAAWEAKRGTKEWNDFYAQLNASQSGGFDEHFAPQRASMADQQQQQPPPGIFPSNGSNVDDRPDPEYEPDPDVEGDSAAGPGSSSNNSSSAKQSPSETVGDVIADESSVRSASSTAAAAAASAGSSTGRTPPDVKPVAMQAGVSAGQTAAANSPAAAAGTKQQPATNATARISSGSSRSAVPSPAVSSATSTVQADTVAGRQHGAAGSVRAHPPAAAAASAALHRPAAAAAVQPATPSHIPAPAAASTSAATPASKPPPAAITAQHALPKLASASTAAHAAPRPQFAPSTAGIIRAPPAMLRAPPLALRAAPVLATTATTATAADRVAARMAPQSNPKHVSRVSAGGPTKGTLDRTPQASAGGRNGRRLLRSVSVSA